MRIETAQQKYLNRTFGLEDPELAEIRSELVRQNVEGMSISGFEARMLQFFTRLDGIKRIAEIGTLFGYSALAFAKALPTDGEIHTVEKNPVNFEIARSFFSKFEAGRKVHAYNGDASVVLQNLKGPFDLVFIDADKSGYPAYLDWAERNVRPGGYIVGDNTFLWGGVYDEGARDMSGKQIAAMKEFNLRLADSSRYDSTLIPTVEGLTIARKRS